MDIDQKFKDLKTNIARSNYSDGIREIGIGIMFILIIFIIKPFPAFAATLVLIISLLVEKIRDKKNQTIHRLLRTQTKV